MQILRASTNEQLLLCYGVMKELRPHHTAETFMETIRQMFGEGYQLWYIEDEGKAMCAAGFRITTTFYDGPIIDFDDFVTREEARKKGMPPACSTNSLTSRQQTRSKPFT
ncbi:MAG TPA: hypothetical protein PK678_03240 [Ferruginibacter sp.]|nr:hypothetical protein [Ferruginibacter sp.]